MRKYILLLVFSISFFSFSQNSRGILSTDANIRRSPAGEKIKILPKGKEVLIIQTKGNWSFIEDPTNNKKGWVSNSLIIINKTIIIKDANVRKNPSGKKLKIISKGTEVVVLQTKNGWSFIRDLSNNKKGWVSSSLISASNVPKNNQNIVSDSVKLNNKVSSEQIIESRLTKMGIKWKWDAFKRNDRSKIKVNNINDFISEVNSYKGVRYEMGGTSRSGIDCSGLIWKGLRATGYNGDRLNAQMLAQSGKLIANKSSLKPGDLVCFTNTTGANKLVQHIGIYVGKNEFLHAPSSGKFVKTNSINDPYYWGERFVFGVRYN